jgi:hypothetical protein
VPEGAEGGADGEEDPQAEEEEREGMREWRWRRKEKFLRRQGGECYRNILKK